MRVTKLIREYVEKTVREKLPYGEPSKTYEQNRKCLADLTQQLNDKVDAYARELLEGVANLPEDFHINRSSFRVFTCASYGSPIQKAAERHEREIREKRQEAIEKILLELELGATKADFERLIAEAVTNE